MSLNTPVLVGDQIHIRDLDISPPVILAPMVGISHSAMRSLLLRLGGVGLLYTEMLAASHLPHESSQSSPFLIRSVEETPLNYQIYISQRESIKPAARKLELIGADGIDINLGCPAPQVRRKGAGGFLAENIDLVKSIVRELRNTTTLPISAKIRLGRTLEKNKLCDFCAMLEDEGIDMIAVHARLHGEKFCRPPRWEWIGHVKSRINIPVIANGGIFTVSDAHRCIDMSGADGVMLGRGGIENPLLFREIAESVYGYRFNSDSISAEDVYNIFINLLEERFAPERRLGRLKQYTHYFSRAYKFGHRLATSIQKSQNMEEAKEKAYLFFRRNKPDSFFSC